MAIGAHTFLKAELFWSFFTHAHTHRRTLAAHWTASAVGSIASVLACKNITHAKIYTHIKRRKKRVASRRETSDATNAPASVGKKKKQKKWKGYGVNATGVGALLSMRGPGNRFPAAARGDEKMLAHIQGNLLTHLPRLWAQPDITINAHHANARTLAAL